MKDLKLIIFCSVAFLLFSCKDDDAKRQAETVRATKQNDSILKQISDNWRFNVAPLSPKVSQRVGGWNEWQQFSSELMQKPVGSLNAYRQKTKDLVAKADQLNRNIPLFFDKPQVRARIAVLNIKIRSLFTYINIDVIPDKKVIAIIKEVTHETTSLQNQMDEIIRISEIPKEAGEEEMLKAMDTVRMANPDAVLPMPQTNVTRPNPAGPMSGRNRPQ